MNERPITIIDAYGETDITEAMGPDVNPTELYAGDDGVSVIEVKLCRLLLQNDSIDGALGRDDMLS